MAFNENVISKLSKKSSTGFDTPYPIGTDAKYISGVRGTHVNNIEEQFLIGFDCITTTEILKDGTEFIVQELRNALPFQSWRNYEFQEYYIIETHNFANFEKAKHFLKKNALYLPGDLKDNKFTSDDQPAGAGSVTFVGVNTEVYSFSADGSTLQIIAQQKADAPVVSLSVLKYQSKIGTDPINVAEKILYAAEDINGKVVQKQIIKNLL